MKGSISLQFTWIFIIIVGAVILAFFVLIAKNRDAAATEQLSIELVQKVGTILKGSAGAPDTIDAYDIPDAKLRVTCTSEGISQLLIGDGSYSIDIEDTPVFSPGDISGKKLLVWTKPFQYPFHSQNIVYITSPRVKYAVLQDGEDDVFAERFVHSFPAALNVQLVQNTDAIASDGYDKVIIIGKNAPITRGDEQHVYLRVQSTTPEAFDSLTDPFAFSIVVAGPPGTTSSTLSGQGLALLQGAFIAGDAELFSCNNQKIERNHARVAQILKERASSLKTEYETNVDGAACATLLDASAGQLLRCNGDEPALVETCIHNSQQYNLLTTLNDDLKRAGSCPEIY